MLNTFTIVGSDIRNIFPKDTWNTFVVIRFNRYQILKTYSISMYSSQTNLMQAEQKAFKIYEACNDFIRRFIHCFRYFEIRIVFWHKSNTIFFKRVETLQDILDYYRHCWNYKSCFYQKQVDRLFLLYADFVNISVILINKIL